jgi:hypothetical protein
MPLPQEGSARGPERHLDCGAESAGEKSATIFVDGAFCLNFAILRIKARRGNGPQTAQGFEPPGTGPWSAPRFGRKRFKTLLPETPPASRGSLAAPVICTVFVAADLARVRFAPKATQLLRGSEMTRCAISVLMHRDRRHLYSITSSARARSWVGNSSLSAFAALRLTTSSNFVGNCTGRPAGFSPRRMRSM